MIVSKNNEKIKYINSLKDKKYREKYNRYVLEGIKVIDEHTSLAEQDSPELIVLCKELLLKAKGGEKIYSLVEKLEKSGKLEWDKNLFEVDRNVFEHISDTETPQGILIVLEKKKIDLETLKESVSKEEKFIILDQVSDAGNMGTIIRSAIAFGVNNIICTKGCVDVYSPKVIRSAMGAIEKVKLYNIDKLDKDVVLKVLEENEYVLCGTDLNAKKYLNEIKPNNKLVYVLGNEANGVSDEYKSYCKENIKIPMEPIQESLNVAIAAAILMYNGYVGGNVDGSKTRN